MCFKKLFRQKGHLGLTIKNWNMSLFPQVGRFHQIWLGRAATLPVIRLFVCKSACFCRPPSSLPGVHSADTLRRTRNNRNHRSWVAIQSIRMSAITGFSSCRISMRKVKVRFLIEKRIPTTYMYAVNCTYFNHWSSDLNIAQPKRQIL